MLECHSKIILDSNVQKFSQFSTFISVNSVCNSSKRAKIIGVSIQRMLQSIRFILSHLCTEKRYRQSLPSAFHGQKLEEQYACQLCHVRRPESPNHPLHDKGKTLFHCGIITNCPRICQVLKST